MTEAKPETSGPITEQPRYQALWADAREANPGIDSQIVALVDTVNLHVDAYRQATGNFATMLDPAVFAPRLQEAKLLLEGFGKKTDTAAIIQRAAAEINTRLLDITRVPNHKYDNLVMREGTYQGMLEDASNIWLWLRQQKLV